MSENVLYYGDNLDILRRYVQDESVDLIYLDPPFKSNQNYNILFKERNGSQSAAQIMAFEVTGQKRKDKEAKVATARDMWVPAINNHGGFGRWAFIEIRDPWNAKNAIREALKRSGNG